MIGPIARTLRVLNSETDPAQIAGAVCLAAIFGLTPLWSLHNLIVLLLVLVLRVNLSSFLLAWGVFTAVAYALDPLFDMLGHAILTAGPLQALWTAFYATDIGRLSDFNNTIVMGSLVATLVALPVLYFATVYLVRNYRSRVLTRIRNTPAYALLQRTRFFELYDTLSARRGGA